MENATKALLIAGSILVGMIVISLFYYMFGKAGILVSDTSKNTLEQEIADENKGFEAFNKRVMYGMDVISVLNKAIDNNKRNNCEFDGSNEFNVNITINLKEQFENLVETYTYNRANQEYEKTRTQNQYTMNKTTYNINNQADYDIINKILIKGENYQDSSGNIQQNSGTVDESKLPGFTWGQNTYKITYYAKADFKRRTFKCTKVEYHNSGRVKNMIFEQI